MFGVASTKSSTNTLCNYQVPVYRNMVSATNMITAVDSIVLPDENIPTLMVEPGYCQNAFVGFLGYKDADLGGKNIVIARSKTCF
jgi:hypothetical protein